MNELFDIEYYNRYGRQLIGEDDFKQLKSESEKAGSVESYLTQRWQSISGRTQERTRRAERTIFGNMVLYLWELFVTVSLTYSPTNRYASFMHKLRVKDEDFGLISFNYDTLLDKAVTSEFGVVFSNFDSYLNFPYIKPHGSVNWLFPARNNQEITDSILGFDPSVRRRTSADQMFNGDAFNIEHLLVFEPEHQAMVWSTIIGRYKVLYPYHLNNSG